MSAEYTPPILLDNGGIELDATPDFEGDLELVATLEGMHVAYLRPVDQIALRDLLNRLHPTSLQAALDAIKALPHEDYCCTKGCPGFGLATCGKVFTYGDECDGSECSCFMSGPLRAIRNALGEDA